MASEHRTLSLSLHASTNWRWCGGGLDTIVRRAQPFVATFLLNVLSKCDRCGRGWVGQAPKKTPGPGLHSASDASGDNSNNSTLSLSNHHLGGSWWCLVHRSRTASSFKCKFPREGHTGPTAPPIITPRHLIVTSGTLPASTGDTEPHTAIGIIHLPSITITRCIGPRSRLMRCVRPIDSLVPELMALLVPCDGVQELRALGSFCESLSCPLCACRRRCCVQPKARRTTWHGVRAQICALHTGQLTVLCSCCLACEPVGG